MRVNIDDSEKQWIPGAHLPPPLGNILTVVITIISKHLLWNCFANQSQILCEVSVGRGNNVYINDPCHMTKMATMPIYGKHPAKISRTVG